MTALRRYPRKSEYNDETMTDMHYVYGLSQENGLDASRRYAEMYPDIEYLPDLINDYENMVHSTKDRRIVVAIEK
ncbi:unnamed protein product [Callosobruchus maculatus]|uniref:Uncharacterized protein n=1 Tax=Callosobruchus maculatus TaxID=64391 RepID=A0A653BEF2_CALMS|nr:unnamed protein product [Callosobruchus maculatus]